MGYSKKIHFYEGRMRFQRTFVPSIKSSKKFILIAKIPLEKLIPKARHSYYTEKKYEWVFSWLFNRYESYNGISPEHKYYFVNSYSSYASARNRMNKMIKEWIQKVGDGELNLEIVPLHDVENEMVLYIMKECYAKSSLQVHVRGYMLDRLGGDEDRLLDFFTLENDFGNTGKDYRLNDRGIKLFERFFGEGLGEAFQFTTNTQIKFAEFKKELEAEDDNERAAYLDVMNLSYDNVYSRNRQGSFTFTYHVNNATIKFNADLSTRTISLNNNRYGGDQPRIELLHTALSWIIENQEEVFEEYLSLSQNKRLLTNLPLAARAFRMYNGSDKFTTEEIRYAKEQIR